MRKDQLDTETDYAYWNGHGGFCVPKRGHEAKIAVKNTLRVEVIAADADADTTDWLIPPKATGVLFKLLDSETGEETFEDDKLVTMWASTARDFAMPWDEFRSVVDPIVIEITEEEKREAELRALSDAVEEAIATRLNMDKKKHVHVNISEYRYRQGRRRAKEEITESISIDINFDSIKEVESWMNHK